MPQGHIGSSRRLHAIASTRRMKHAASRTASLRAVAVVERPSSAGASEGLVVVREVDTGGADATAARPAVRADWRERYQDNMDGSAKERPMGDGSAADADVDVDPVLLQQLAASYQVSRVGGFLKGVEDGGDVKKYRFS